MYKIYGTIQCDECKKVIDFKEYVEPYSLIFPYEICSCNYKAVGEIEND